jgi:hypothetical protein
MNINITEQQAIVDLVDRGVINIVDTSPLKAQEEILGLFYLL